MRDAVAIVLAAGQGSRLGGPKALLLVGRGAGEMPLVEAQCRDRLAADSARALAVVRPDVAARIGDRLRAAGAEVVVSRAPDALGPAGSLAAAAAHLAQSASAPRAVVVTPVDVRVAPATVASLLAALDRPAAPFPPAAPPFAAPASVPAASPFAAPASAPAAPAPAASALPPLAVLPRFAGRRGHPVVLSFQALARYLAPDPPPLRDHLRALAERAVALDVPDPHVLEDLDRPDQTDLLARLTLVPSSPPPSPRFFVGPPASLH